MKIIVHGKTYKVEFRKIENGINWIYMTKGNHGYAVADLGDGNFGKVNRLF